MVPYRQLDWNLEDRVGSLVRGMCGVQLMDSIS